jgi:hypothetical protein
MSVPNFAGEQPGKTYYLSPLNAFVFGIVDCSKERTTHAAHTYFEADGKKDGNNVASMLWNELKRKGLTTGEQVQEINIVMDNCAGQNKNRMVNPDAVCAHQAYEMFQSKIGPLGQGPH